MFGEPYASELSAIRSKLALAQALQQAYGQQPQGQMVSGHYVKPAWTQQLSGLAGVLVPALMQAKANDQMGQLQGRYANDQTQAIGTMQQIAAGKPANPQTPNFVMQPDESGQPAPTFSPEVAGDPLAAEAYGQKSPFPQVQALAKAMMEDRLKRRQAMQRTLGERVPLADVPKVYSGEYGDLKPKQTVQYVDGLPVATPAEVTPGGPQPTRMGAGYTTGTMPGADGRPMAIQTNPLTGKVDSIDKAPKVSATANAGRDVEDPYLKEAGNLRAKSDGALYESALQARSGNAALQRIEKILATAPPDGGPLAQKIVWTRNLLASLGMPVDKAVDEANTRITAEYTTRIADQVLTGGRGISNDDRVALEQAFPSFKTGIPIEQLPAFIDQLKQYNNGKIAAWQERFDALPPQYKAKYPITFGAPQGSLRQAPTGWTPEQEARLQELERKKAQSGK